MLKFHIVTVLMFAIVIPTRVPSQSSPSTPQPLDDPEAYKVYAALLPEEWTVRSAHAKTLVFQQETMTNQTCMPSGKPLETDWSPVLNDFTSANAAPKLLRAGFDLGVPYVVVPSADIQTTFQSPTASRTGGWDGFFQKYPESGGYMAVSAVGFDASKQRAMVYMEHSCGLLCGGGTHHLLERRDGVWREARLAGITNCRWASLTHPSVTDESTRSIVSTESARYLLAAWRRSTSSNPTP